MPRKREKQERTRLGLELEAAARDILAHLKGEKVFPIRRYEVPDKPVKPEPTPQTP
jgi:hypothetical protein